MIHLHVVLKNLVDSLPLVLFDTFISRWVSRMRPAENADGGIEAMLLIWQAEMCNKFYVRCKLAGYLSSATSWLLQ